MSQAEVPDSKILPADGGGDLAMVAVDKKELAESSVGEELLASKTSSDGKLVLSDLTDPTTGKLSVQGVTQFVALEKEVCRESMAAIGGLDQLLSLIHI